MPNATKFIFFSIFLSPNCDTLGQYFKLYQLVLHFFYFLREREREACWIAKISIRKLLWKRISITRNVFVRFGWFTQITCIHCQMRCINSVVDWRSWNVIAEIEAASLKNGWKWFCTLYTYTYSVIWDILHRNLTLTHAIYCVLVFFIWFTIYKLWSALENTDRLVTHVIVIVIVVLFF